MLVKELLVHCNCEAGDELQHLQLLITYERACINSVHMLASIADMLSSVCVSPRMHCPIPTTHHCIHNHAASQQALAHLLLMLKRHPFLSRRQGRGQPLLLPPLHAR